MTRGTRGFLNFMFFLSALAGGALIVKGDGLASEVANFGPVVVVVLFALVVAIAQKAGADSDLADHYGDSIYFLGFLFTLVSLATLFHQMGDGGLGSSLAADGSNAIDGAGTGGDASLTLLESQRFALSSRMIEDTFSLVGVAVTTSVAGVLMRNMVRSWYLKNQGSGNGDLEAAVSELRKIAEGMSGGFTESMQALGAYFEERKELAGQMKIKEQAYVAGLEGFTDTVGTFARRLSEVDKQLLESSESLGQNIRKQADGIAETDSSLRSMAVQLRGLKTELETINLKTAADELAGFGKETGELNAVLDSLIDIVERKVDLLRRAG